MIASSAPATGFEKQSSDFSVSSRKIIAQGSDVHVKEFLFRPGEDIPWHHHSAVFDVFYCLAGTLTVQRIDIASQQQLADLVIPTGESAKVVPGTAHRPVNQQHVDCRFLVVQGVGTYDYRRFAPNNP
jgi:mannose-6-phosphate isomerase-like protein (cupin superfamily)